MKKIMFIGSLLGVLLCIGSLPQAANRRVYCKPQGVIVEQRLDEDYTEENARHNLRWFVIDETGFPEVKYREQLRCDGDSLVADVNYKPPWAVKRDQIKETQVALDAELGKAEPDLITVIRLQRAIEVLKQ